MKNKAIKNIIIGGSFIIIFTILTFLVKIVSVKPVGVNGTKVGFAFLNVWFFKFSGVNMWLYFITDWLGFVPIFIAIIFAIIGLFQLIKRKNILKVDYDILILGVYYIIVFAIYFLFEKIYINYRPVLINGFMEKSYPSSTTLLTLTIILPFMEQVNRKISKKTFKIVANILSTCFIIFMVGGRLLSGVHWLTDIIAGIILSVGLFLLYKGFVLLANKK